MHRRFTRAIFAAAAAGATIATFGLTAAGTADAATGPVVFNHHFAGYHTALHGNWRFRYVATTLPVKACRIAPSKNPSAQIELFGGTNWSANIAVLCNGGANSVGFFDQKTATTHSQGAFQLSPRVGDRLRISIKRNVPGHQDSFTVTNLRTGRSQTVLVTTSTAVVYHHAFVGSAIRHNADAMPLPTTNTLLWSFGNSRVVTYGGVVGTLTGPWATVKEVDRTPGGVIVMFPGNLSSTGTRFSTFLHAAA
jgi:hypothetical protein